MDSLVLLDTNIALDFLVANRPGHKDAARLIRRSIEDDGLELMFLASSLKDVYYILNRLSGDEKRARQDVCRVRKMFTVVPLTNDVVDDALASDEPDFEDALIRSCAEKHRCTAIITRDKKAYVQSSIPKFTASDWLKNQTRSNSLRAKHNMD